MPKKTEVKKYKDTFGVGVTIQLDEYEPIKLYASTEMEHEGLDSEEVDVLMAKRVMARLNDMTSEVALKIAEIKAKAIEDLSDPED